MGILHRGSFLNGPFIVTPIPLPHASSDDKDALKRLQDAASARSAELGLPASWRRTELEPLLSSLLGPPREVAG